MFMTKVKTVLGCILLLIPVATAAGVVAHQSQIPADPAKAQVVVLNPNPMEGDAEKAGKQPAVQKANVIGVGDRLRIQVRNYTPSAPISDVYQVEASGNVALGVYYGRVKVDGQTLEEAEKSVNSHLRTKILPPFDVQITHYVPSHSTEDVDVLKRRVDELEKEVKSLRAVVNELRKRQVP